MKLSKALESTSTTIVATTTSVAFMFLIFVAAFTAWKPRQTKENFMDCSASATCTLWRVFCGPSITWYLTVLLDNLFFDLVQVMSNPITIEDQLQHAACMWTAVAAYKLGRWFYVVCHHMYVITATESVCAFHLARMRIHGDNGAFTCIMLT